MEHLELRAKLAAIDKKDLAGVFALFEEAQRYTRQDLRNINVMETVRRSEYAMAHSLRAAQVRGEVASKAAPRSGTPVTNYLPKKSGVTSVIYQFMRLNEEQFERVLEQAKEQFGSLTREVINVVILGMKAELDAKPVALQVTHSRRGAGLITNLAMTVNSLASTCREINPGEIDPVQYGELVQQARENVGVIRGFLKKVDIDV